MTQSPSEPDKTGAASDPGDEAVEVAPGFVALAGSEERFPVWHGEPHVADPAQRQRVKEGIRRAGFTPAPLPDPGNQAHTEWHLKNPGVKH